MLTIIYPEAFTRGLNGTAQGPGFDGCFAREQDGNGRNSDPMGKIAAIGL
jgi:hypothetical protein